MSFLVRIEGESDPIEELRGKLLADQISVSQVHQVSLDSKHL